MTARLALAIWGAALALVALALAFLWLVPPLRGIPNLPPATPVVIIGSSMTGYAVPLRPPPEGVLGDGRAHARWQTGAITEARTLELLEGALDAGAQTVLVEANAFASSRAAARRARDRHLAGQLDLALSDMTDRLQTALFTLRGRPAQPVNRREPDLSPRPWYPERENLTAMFPAPLTSPEDPARLTAALDRARAQGTEVVFFEPPRPASVVAAQTPEGYAALMQHLHAFANGYGSTFISFGNDWPDTLFRDRGHMNADGRARFLRELPQAWKERR